MGDSPRNGARSRRTLAQNPPCCLTQEHLGANCCGSGLWERSSPWCHWIYECPCTFSNRGVNRAGGGLIRLQTACRKSRGVVSRQAFSPTCRPSQAMQAHACQHSFALFYVF